ncbi:MAG: M23 family metallopeptidase [Dehalococcoidia bacterium]|nr:M23 family metallopeptidase [Dehalococcoidia bacterium]
MKNFILLFVIILLMPISIACSFFSEEELIITASESTQNSIIVPVEENKSQLNVKSKEEIIYPKDFILPIKGSCLTENLALLPGAPRVYRNGIHEGVDFYQNFACVDVISGTEVYAIETGTVIRVDNNYVGLNQGLLEILIDADSKQYNLEQKLDIYRGRQIWLEHRYGIVSRYAHLSGINDDVKLGFKVSKGQLIGFVGNSGTPESITNPGTENHLHLEIRQGSSYLGYGQPQEAMFELYSSFFINKQ